MNKKPSYRENRLRRYSLAATAMAASATAVDAQILYTDVNPDYQHLGGEGGITIDLNQDSVPDFEIFATDTVINFFDIKRTKVRPFGNNFVGGTVPAAYNYALALDVYSMVDTNLVWINATNTMAFNIDGANPYGEQWNGVQDKYLPLNVRIGQYRHFGWARLDVGLQGDHFVLKDYAIQMTPETPIAAGDQGLNVGMEDLAGNDIQFLQQGMQLMITSAEANQDGTVELYDLSGKLLLTENLREQQTILQLHGLNGGMYIAKVMVGSAVLTRKIFIK